MGAFKKQCIAQKLIFFLAAYETRRCGFCTKFSYMSGYKVSTIGFGEIASTITHTDNYLGIYFHGFHCAVAPCPREINSYGGHWSIHNVCPLHSYEGVIFYLNYGHIFHHSSLSTSWSFKDNCFRSWYHLRLFLKSLFKAMGTSLNFNMTYHPEIDWQIEVIELLNNTCGVIPWIITMLSMGTYQLLYIYIWVTPQSQAKLNNGWWNVMRLFTSTTIWREHNNTWNNKLINIVVAWSYKLANIYLSNYNRFYKIHQGATIHKAYLMLFQTVSNSRASKERGL